MAESQVSFHFERKRSPKACVLPYQVYLNGVPVGRLENGQSFVAQTDRQEEYLIEVRSQMRVTAHLRDMGSAEYLIQMVPKGGWNTPVWPQLFLVQDGKEVLLPITRQKIKK